MVSGQDLVVERHGNRKRRSQIMLDDDLYRGLAAEAAIEGRSISSLVREAISQWLTPRRPRGIKESPFWALVGTGHGGGAGNLPVSENVDFYLYGRSEPPEVDDDACRHDENDS
jgi:hypothetical protein